MEKIPPPASELLRHSLKIFSILGSTFSRPAITSGTNARLWTISWPPMPIRMAPRAGCYGPANYASDLPGYGFYEGRKNDVPYAVINLQGRIFMASNDDPFRKADELLKQVTAKIIFVDVHAEATSEKIALGWYLDGRVTALVGTHTHVPTADERVLPGGTAYITDVGMTGPYDGVIGVKKELVIGRFLNNMPVRFEPATDDARLCAVVVEADDGSGKAKSIQRIMVS